MMLAFFILIFNFTQIMYIQLKKLFISYLMFVYILHLCTPEIGPEGMKKRVP